jgi:hypothetical protein
MELRGKAISMSRTTKKSALVTLYRKGASVTKKISARMAYGPTENVLLFTERGNFGSLTKCIENHGDYAQK